MMLSNQVMRATFLEQGTFSAKEANQTVGSESATLRWPVWRTRSATEVVKPQATAMREK
jgi:hypothetical protein